jgi:hypothetical protein
MNNRFNNLATSDKWILGLKTEELAQKLDIDADEIYMKITALEFNGVDMAESEIGRGGETITIPAYADNPDKTLTINYLIDENWEEFAFLLRWYSANAKCSVIDGDDTDYGSNVYLNNVSLYLLNSYKKPKLEIIFEGCWIKNLGTFDFSYENPDIDIKSALTLKYQQYKFKFLTGNE